MQHNFLRESGFYPRHPRGWRRRRLRHRKEVRNVSIHATLAGGDKQRTPKTMKTKAFLSTPPSRVATWDRQPLSTSPNRFYPRHPRGWRPVQRSKDFVFKCVSIHATLAGGDGSYRVRITPRKKFLSTPPSRVATHLKPLLSTATVFLSTPPSRVATCMISLSSSKRQMFLSTPPSRVATLPSNGRAMPGSTVSIHATLAGGDLTLEQPELLLDFVSIHATLAGGDALPGVGGSTKNCFYPRHPRGWRRRRAVAGPPVRRFYPRHPRGWRPPFLVIV